MCVCSEKIKIRNKTKGLKINQLLVIQKARRNNKHSMVEIVEI